MQSVTVGFDGTQPHLRFFYRLTYRSIVFGPPPTTQAAYYDFEDCECPPSQTISSGLFGDYEFTGPEGSEPPVLCDFDFEITTTCDTTECTDNCCTGFGSTIEDSTFNLQQDADGVCDVSAVNKNISIIPVASSCIWQWGEIPTGTMSCFTDSNGDDWTFDTRMVEIISTDTAGTRPCTTMTYKRKFSRDSDSTLAEQVWNFDFDFCSRPSGVLALESTSHTFPFNSPTFPTVTITS